jgi:hypothetical protein
MTGKSTAHIGPYPEVMGGFSFGAHSEPLLNFNSGRDNPLLGQSSTQRLLLSKQALEVSLRVHTLTVPSPKARRPR